MLLTLSISGPHAPDFSFLLHKHPDRAQCFELSFGNCHVFYTENTADRSTVGLLLEVDTVKLAKGKQRRNSFALAGYVNDRPYVASSFLSTAITQVLGSALSGNCTAKPELVQKDFPLEATIDLLPAGSETFLRRLFEPLGYQVQAESSPLDSKFPGWGMSPYFSVHLKNCLSLSLLLKHLYVLVPVFDNRKHYFVSRDEIDKLLSKGEGWLAEHPEKEIIVGRYLRFQHGLARQALQRLVPELEVENAPSDQQHAQSPEQEKVATLNEQRLQIVLDEIKRTGGSQVIDLGCGEGKLTRLLFKEQQFHKIVGIDVSIRSLEIASRRLRLEDLPSFQADRIKLIHGSLMYRDSRFEKFDVAAVVEVIEHLDPPRLAAFERVVFEHARPTTVVLTTPNAEYNVMWPSLPAGQFRHTDHRFEWTRKQFQAWCEGIGEKFGYTAEFKPVGPIDEKVGSPTQMAVFRLGRRVETIESTQPNSAEVV